MTKRMELGGYLIVSLEGQLSADKALGELVENAVDAQATIISIVLTKRSMTIWDNGEGCDDPNLIATPSKSLSRHKSNAIGSKAIGAKQAMATFGRRWDIHTVPKEQNKYHHYIVEWDENGKLPYEYDGPALPRHSAPSEIKNDGTKITVTDRREGFPSLRLDKICSTLEERYRPFLKSGGTITVRNPEIGHDHRLRNPVDNLSLFSSKIIDLDGKAAGRSFTIRYGALKEDHAVLSGCHFIYGPRVVLSDGKVGKFALPSSCYIDVILSDKWKKCLATNKDDIVRYKDGLIDEVERLLGPWILEQKEEASEYKLRLLSGVVSDMLNESIAMLDPNTAGEYQPKPRVKKDVPPSPPQPPSPPPEIKIKITRRRRAIDGGSLGIESQKKCARLIMEPDKTLGPHLFRATFSSSGDEITIRLNTGERQREIAEYYRQNRIDDLYKVAVLAFSVLVANNPGQFNQVFSGLQNQGYQIDQTDGSPDIISKVSNFMVDALYGRRGSIKRKVA